MAKNTVKKKFKLYTPQNGDTLDKIAAREKQAGNKKISGKSIAKFNWGTDDADTIQEKLRDELGCHKRGSDNNYVITADCKSGVLKIPVRYKLKKNQTNQFFKIRVKKKKKPPKQFIACAKVKGITFDSGESFIKPTVVDTLKTLATELQKYPEGKVMIWGHTDDDERKADDEAYTKKLSDNRAKSVHAFILNDVDTWMKLYNEEGWTAGVFRIILKDLGKNVDNPNTQAAIKRYQTAKGFGGDGSLTIQTKKELFKDYMTKHDVDLPGVDKQRFMDPTYMGCSYFNLEGDADQMNRRVMFYLFNKDRLPVLPCSLGDTFPCTKQMKPPKYRHKKSYNCSFYDSVGKGCDRMAAEAAQKMAWVYLKLVYLDPEDQTKTRPFPKDMDVTVRFKDGSTKKVKTKEGGVVEVLVQTSKQELSLQFPNKKTKYVVVEPSGQAAKVELKGEKEIKEAIKNKHRLWRLPSFFETRYSDWSSSNLHHNDDKGHFEISTISTGEIGTKAAPATYKLDPHWLYLRWEFFDRMYGHSNHNHKRVPMPPVLIAGMRKIKLNKVSTKKYKSPQTACLWGVESSDAAKACQAIPWIVSKHSKGKKKGKKLDDLDKELVIEFGEKETYVHSKAHNDRELVELKRKNKEDAKKLAPGVDRGKYYDVPTLWKSCNQHTRLQGNVAKRFGDLTSAEIKVAHDGTKPLRFVLDDVVLVRSNGRQDVKDRTKTNGKVSLSANSRIALFYLDSQDATHRFAPKIWKPWRDTTNADANLHLIHTFWSNVTFQRNHITDYHLDTRAVFFANGCYHIFDRRAARTSGFSFRKGMLMGARAAMINDKRIGWGETIDGRKSNHRSNHYAVRWAGHYDLNYLHYCGVSGAGANRKVVGALVTHWSARFRRQGAGTTPQDVVNHRNKGLHNAMVRWNLKRYKLEKHLGDEDILIKLHVIFEGKMPTRGGRHKCLVTIKAGRDNMGHTESDQSPGSFQGSGALNAADYDGIRLNMLTNAHEFGHASGLYDDYLEACHRMQGNNYISYVGPQYSEWYPAVPYYLDKPSMMRHNQVPRMRMWWSRVNWLNDNGGKVGNTKRPLYPFLKGTQFKITYRVTGGVGNGNTLNFQLCTRRDMATGNQVITRRYRNIYNGAYRDNNVRLNGATHRADCYLYKLGDGEYAHMLPPAARTYGGILSVRTNMRVVFRDPPGNANDWTDIQMRRWIARLTRALHQAISRKFRIEGPANHDFQHIILIHNQRFRIRRPNTGSDVKGSDYVTQGNTHYTFRVRKGAAATFPNNHASTTVNVGCTMAGVSDWARIVRYIFGKNTGNAAIAVADLAALQNWVIGELVPGFVLRTV